MKYPLASSAKHDSSKYLDVERGIKIVLNSDEESVQKQNDTNQYLSIFTAIYKNMSKLCQFVITYDLFNCISEEKKSRLVSCHNCGTLWLALEIIL